MAMYPGKRLLLVALLMGGLSWQVPPMAWAQLADVDPALHAAVEALIAKDPVVAADPELASLCRDIAEATITDPRERAAVTNEVIALQREGVEAASIIPQEVREAAREQFTAVQGQMREQLETLRTTDPEKAKEMELMMREGERQMEAFSRGEQYTPSTEMVEHAKDMFKEWKETALEQGASPEMLARAEMEFSRWSGGEMTGMMGGPGHEAGGSGGGMPSPEQMEAMVAAGQMTPEQFEMAKAYGADPEKFMATHPGYDVLGPDAVGSGGPLGGTWEGGPQEGTYGPTDAFEHWAAENPNISPEQMEQYREMAEQYQYEPPTPPENGTYDNLQSQNFDNTNPLPGGNPPPQPEVLVATHDHDSNGSPDEFHYDTNSDGIADHAHPTLH